MLLHIHDPNQQKKTKPNLQPPVIGIDLGTTYSLCAVINDSGQPRFLTPEHLVPSVVGLKNDCLVVGHEALAILKDSPQMVVTSVKRFIGRLLQDIPSDLVKRYRMEMHPEQGLVLHLGPHRFSPVQLSAALLTHLKQEAEKTLGVNLNEAVITVPAYFDAQAREATQDAARMAGLVPRRLLSEPTAAILAYGLEAKPHGVYGVYDFGGGTFDMSVVALDQGVFKVLATAGDVSLGGDDMDYALGKHITPDFSATPQLQVPVQKLKMRLSQESQVAYKETIEGRCISGKITRYKAYQLWRPLIEKTLRICDQVLFDLGEQRKNLQGIVLAGGATHMPLVQEMVKQHFDVPVFHHGSPDTLVALGAAHQARNLSEGHHVLLDVTPLSLGLEVMGGLVEKIIERNTPLPIEKKQFFTTYEDGQDGILFHVVQGERETAKDCRSLGRFELKGIAPQRSGGAKISVLFQMDIDGLLAVSAHDMDSGARQDIQIQPSYGLSRDAVEEMIRQSLACGKRDMAHRLFVQAQSQAQSLLRGLALETMTPALDKVQQHLLSLLDAWHKEEQELSVKQMHQRTQELHQAMASLYQESRS